MKKILKLHVFHDRRWEDLQWNLNLIQALETAQLVLLFFPFVQSKAFNLTLGKKTQKHLKRLLSYRTQKTQDFLCCDYFSHQSVLPLKIINKAITFSLKLWSEKSNDINNNLIMYQSTLVFMWFEFAFSTLHVPKNHCKELQS